MRRCQISIACRWRSVFLQYAVILLILPLLAANAAAQEGCLRAVLIGIRNYEHAPDLPYTVNDIERLDETLTERCGREHPVAVEWIDDRFGNVNRGRILTALPQQLAQARPDDRVMVFFSGHGFRDADGKMYLATSECDPNNPTETGIPIQWLRDQLAGCAARLKLLVIDACHAGSEKGDDQDVSLTAEELGEPFRGLEGVVTLASSSADQKSMLWAEKQQSLFAYWLVQALKGHADQDTDGAVDIDELYRYLHRTVSDTAKNHLGREQTPVRIVRTGTRGVPAIVYLKPTTLRQALYDMATEISWALEEQKADKLAVLEFAGDSAVGELFGADFGVLGRYCASQIEEHLLRLAADSYSVVDRRQVQRLLADNGISIDDLGSADTLQRLSEQAGGLQALLSGTLQSRAGRVVHMKCQLNRVGDQSLMAVAGGVAHLNESEWAMLGRSVDTTMISWRQEKSAPILSEEEANEIDRRSEGPHPLSDPRFPYRVSVRVDGRDRPATFRENRMHVRLSNGEVYEIWVENRTPRPVIMRLLVDGLNTLPQEIPVKGVRTMEVAPRVNLDEARFWILDPSAARRWAVRGFVTKTGSEGRLLEFKVVDAAQSLAARKQFTEQIGLITAAFYDAHEKKTSENSVGAPAPGAQGPGHHRRGRAA